MCLGVPMKIVEMKDADCGTAELEGVRYAVSLNLLEEPKIGDYVIVHAGFAIERLDEDEANERLALFKQLGEPQAKP